MAEIKSYWRNYVDEEWVDGGAGREAFWNYVKAKNVAIKLKG